MKGIFLCLGFSLFSIVNVSAQRELTNPLVDSKIAIEKGLALHEEGKYKEAIAVYLDVPPSDTSYSTVLNELIVSYYSDSNYVAAESCANRGLELFPENFTVWYGLLADIYDETNRSELALRAYDTVLAVNPYKYTVWFNKGVALFRLKRFDEATTCFQRCIMLNPFYSSAHYSIGKVQMMKGNMVQAMLSLSTSLIVSPGNGNLSNIASLLSSISEVNTETTEFLAKYKPGKQDNFEEVQDILVSKLSLMPKYKLRAALDDKVVRQLQVMVEKLEYNPSDHGFWMEYYVPIFKKIWDNEQFEPMIFHMFSELNIKEVKEYNKKEKKKVEAFTSLLSDYFIDLRENNELAVNKREKSFPKLYVKNYAVAGKGAFGLDSRKQAAFTGKWEFFFQNGRTKSIGSFNQEGLPAGEWIYYYENGKIREISNFENGVESGKGQKWHDNGLLYAESNYAQGEKNGLETVYYYSGRLRSVINYKNGKKDGSARYFNLQGKLETTTNYADDLEEGKETGFYANGQVSSVANYVKNMADGEYKQYHKNGKIKTTGTFREGKREGLWNSYYEDGKLDEVENYVNGKLDGEWISYHSNGAVASKCIYRKGEIEGIKQDYDDDGIMYCESLFERSRLRDIKFYDKKGSVISNTTSRRGNGQISFYAADGSKNSEGFYSKDGLAEGKFLNYFRNGHVSGEIFYKNGFREGKSLTYYANNKLRGEGNYKEDKANGYFVNYFNNGQVSDEGWFVDGERQGTFIDYDLLGNVTSKLYYLDDKLHGISEYYTPTGKLEHKEYYDNGWFNKIEQFDSTGKIVASSLLDKGEGKLRFIHLNGSVYLESNYKNYQRHGSYTLTNGDGSKNSLSYYKNGELDSAYKSWYPNGKVHVEGNYKEGKKTGTWKYYRRNGKLFETEQYEDGELDGPDVAYNINGQVEKQSIYKNGAINGEVRYFGYNGDLMIVFNYKDNTLLSYSFEDKMGKLVTPIELVKGAGIVDSYYKNGNKSAHIVYNEGVVDGVRIFYSTNGREETVGNRINGLQHGPFKTHYPGGKIMREANYYYGELHGLSREYDEDGSLISEENYYLGDLHGECKYYTEGKATTYTYHFNLLESKN